MMTPEEFWNCFCPGQSVEEFAARCEDGEIRPLVEGYVDELPHLYGIVCCLDWPHTFRGTPQYNRQEVVAGLVAHLEQHAEHWDKGKVPGPMKDYLSKCKQRPVDHLIDTELDQRKSFEATLQRYAEKQPTLPSALPMINVGVDMPEMMLPDEKKMSAEKKSLDKNLPAEQPPAEQPPAEQPPAEQPPAEQPPVEQPPAEQPPAEQPPVEQPPDEQPPDEQPPDEQPPDEQPPDEQPPDER